MNRRGPVHLFKYRNKVGLDGALEVLREAWHSLTDAPEVLAVTDAQREELDRRIEAHRANPEAAVSWESLRQELLEG